MPIRLLLSYDEENAFKPSSKVPIVLTVLILIKSSKSKIFPEIQNPLLAMTPYKNIFFLKKIMPSACKSTEYTLPFSKLGMCAW